MSNDFLPFATDPGANVESQTAWAADVTVSDGFQAGLAPSAKANKAWRQPSVITSQLANLMAAVLSQNVLDNGNTNVIWSQIWQTLLTASAFVDTGATNALLVAAPAGLTFPAPISGTRVSVKVANTTTAPNPTLNWMGTGNKNLRYPGGGTIPAGAMIAGAYADLEFDGTNWQLLGTAFNQPSSLAHGECYMSYVSTTGIILSPQNGCNLLSAGVQYQLPAAGISAATTNVTVNGVANQSLAASTAYLVSFNGAAGILKYWQVGSYSHGPDTTAGNIGVEVITSGGSPQTAETLVGIVYTDSAAHLSVSTVASWFQFQDKTGKGSYTTTRGVGSLGSWIEPNAEIRVPFVTFANREIEFYVNGELANTGGSPTSAWAAVAIDNNTTPYNDLGNGYATLGAPGGGPIGIKGQETLSEGGHFATFIAYASASTLSFLGGAFAAGNAITTLGVKIKG